MLLLGLDFETTGLDTGKDRITEVGAVLWDTDTKAPIALLSELMYDASYMSLSKEITDLTGITDGMLQRFGSPPELVWKRLLGLMVLSKYVVAHNGTKFDRLLFDAECKRQGISLELGGAVPGWLDSSVDIPYPDKIKTRKLVHLAAEHGFVNPFAHRAVFDVLTMLTVLSRYDIDEIVQLSKEPSVELAAMTEKPWLDSGRSTDLAKARGYRWDGVKKQWLKIVKQSQVEKEKTHGEFPVTEQSA